MHAGSNLISQDIKLLRRTCNIDEFLVIDVLRFHMLLSFNNMIGEGSCVGAVSYIGEYFLLIPSLIIK